MIIDTRSGTHMSFPTWMRRSSSEDICKLAYGGGRHKRRRAELTLKGSVRTPSVGLLMYLGLESNSTARPCLWKSMVQTCTLQLSDIRHHPLHTCNHCCASLTTSRVDRGDTGWERSMNFGKILIKASPTSISFLIAR